MSKIIFREIEVPDDYNDKYEWTAFWVHEYWKYLIGFIGGMLFTLIILIIVRQLVY